MSQAILSRSCHDAVEVVALQDWLWRRPEAPASTAGLMDRVRRRATLLALIVVRLGQERAHVRE
jgi:hypothetical protein